jgi:hypothetical protein
MNASNRPSRHKRRLWRFQFSLFLFLAIVAVANLFFAWYANRLRRIEPVTIEVKSDGVYVNSQKTDWEELSTYLAAVAERKRRWGADLDSVIVHLFVDQGESYDNFVRALEACRNAGFARLQMATLLKLSGTNDDYDDLPDGVADLHKAFSAPSTGP